jgi:ABC-type phosphate transport system substrate-binding protein
MRFSISFFLLLIFSAITISCNTQPGKELDTPVSGNINISVDESYQPLISAEQDVFQALYQRAKVNITYTDENTAINNLLNDTVKTIIINRKLTENEAAALKQYGITPRVTKLAVDAVALVVHNENPDSMMTYEQLSEIMQGKIQRWNTVSGKSKPDSIIIVFDNKQSSNARFLKETFLKESAFPKNVFAVNSNAEVINYVAAHKRALGVIGVNWVSDKGDSAVNNFLEKVKVVSLAPLGSGPNPEYYKPYQAYVALKYYPLIRDVFGISRETRVGLGTGFVSFVASDKGQMIIRRAGMLPATIPVRIVNVN